MRQTNVVKLETFATEAIPPEVVLVGSSLTENLKADEVADKASNLGMIAGCSQTGLEALIHSKYRPKAVIVELNRFVTRGTDFELIRGLYNAFSLDSTRNLRCLQQRYNLVNVVLSTLQAKYPSAWEARPNPSLLPRLIHEQLSTLSGKYHEEQLRIFAEQLAIVRQQILILRNEGVAVILHFIPEAYQLEASAGMSDFRSLATKIFPPGQYDWLARALSNNWHTSDGIHLLSANVRIYDSYLNKALCSRGLAKPVISLSQ